jgi:hypothetical protein
MLDLLSFFEVEFGFGVFSVMLAAKFFDDQYYNNAYYAQIGGVSTEEINTLEVEFLFMINFSLHVTRELYDQYHRELTKHMSSGCSCQQGIQNNSSSSSSRASSSTTQQTQASSSAVAVSNSTTTSTNNNENDRQKRLKTR